jgi:uncharacterized protein YuzE
MAHILREASPAVFEYDGDAKALYYRLTYEPVARTIGIGDRVAVDVDDEGNAVGIEVLDPPGFTMTVTSAGTDHQGTVDLIAKGHLGTPCPKPRDGGLCGCDDADLDDVPRDCYRGRCDC